MLDYSSESVESLSYRLRSFVALTIFAMKACQGLLQIMFDGENAFEKHRLKTVASLDFPGKPVIM
jgi:hypothetical protein